MSDGSDKLREFVSGFVERFAKNKEDGVADKRSPERKVFTDEFMRFVKRREGYEGKSAGEWEEILKKEDVFLSAVEERHNLDVSKDYTLENRISTSDLLVLYDLLVYGGLERIFPGAEAKIEQGDLDGVVDAMILYLKHVREKNGEKEKASKRESAVTMGLENEYEDPMRDLAHTYNEVWALIPYPIRRGQYINGKFVASTEEDIKNYITSVFKGRRLSVFKRVNKIFFGKEFYAANHNELEEIDKGLHANAMGLLRERDEGVYKWDPDGPVHEYKGAPSFSWEAQIRDMLMLHMGEKETSWNIHLNIKGIILSTEHYEIMDSLLISAAAGFLPKVRANTVEEKYKKISLGELEGREWYFYFPYFLSKEGNKEMIKYPSGSPIETDGLVEERSLFDYPVGGFIDLVRHTQFTYFASLAVRAYQMEPKERNSKEKKLASAWRKLMKDWKGVLESVSLEPIKGADAYFLTRRKRDDGEMDWDDDFSDRSTEYEYILSQIRERLEEEEHEGFDSPDEMLKNKTRRIIREFKKTVAEVVK